MVLTVDYQPVVVIGGPTASGKSAVALEVAECFKRDGIESVIINADALQLYRDLCVLTARPDSIDEARFSHRLYGVVDGAERGSVAKWLDMVRTEIGYALDQGKCPIVVGGSGMYLHALTHGLSPVPEIDTKTRLEAVQFHSEMGGNAFHAMLAKLDPESAEKLNANDTQRLIRAYEVVKGTGKTLPQWQNTLINTPPRSWNFKLFMIEPSRPVLYQNCDRRFDIMLEKGALDEVRVLLSRQLDSELPIMKAVGVPELALFICGEINLNMARLKAQQLTRNYAKRQLTWFHHQFGSALRIIHDAPQEIARVKDVARVIYTDACTNLPL